ncbi:hypothetical protein OKW50_007828 [Paraburkholderia youngii]
MLRSEATRAPLFKVKLRESGQMGLSFLLETAGNGASRRPMRLRQTAQNAAAPESVTQDPARRLFKRWQCNASSERRALCPTLVMHKLNQPDAGSRTASRIASALDVLKAGARVATGNRNSLAERHTTIIGNPPGGLARSESLAVARLSKSAEANLSLAFMRLSFSPHAARRASKSRSGPTARDPFARLLCAAFSTRVPTHLDNYLDVAGV